MHHFPRRGIRTDLLNLGMAWYLTCHFNNVLQRTSMHTIYDNRVYQFECFIFSHLFTPNLNLAGNHMALPLPAM